MGCGRVGAMLARSLNKGGHDVAVIDSNAAAFRRLGTSFEGQTITGLGFDRETLVAAGIRDAYAFAAVSSGDNSNILAARVARETFGVEHVAARIYDPERAEVYQRLGIPTVATVSWTAEQIMRRILPMGAQAEYRDPSGSVVLAEVHTGQAWIGRRSRDIEEASGARIACITRYGVAFVPGDESVVQDGDLVHAVFATDAREHVEQVFENGPGGV